MNKLHSYIARCITLLVALQILNIGLFAQEFKPIVTSSVTPGINIINTIDEYIAEVVLDHKDAVPETKEHSKKDIRIHKHPVLKLINLLKTSSFACTLQQISSPDVTGFSNKYNYQFFEDITPPPPKHTVNILLRLPRIIPSNYSI